MTRLPLRLVIFDCDGVLVDSEGPSNRVVAEAISALGWPMDAAESMRRFVGHRLSDIPPVVAAHTGRAVPAGWVEALRVRLIAVLSGELEAMPGAHEALRAVTALGLPYRIASNSSHEEMAAKFARVGMVELVEGRTHSARDVARGKPAPDVFLHAAAAAGVPPGACLVVEDSVPGAVAARAAGMACVALAPHGGDALAAHGGDAGLAATLAKTGAVLIRSLAELPAVVRRAMAA